MKNIPDKIIVHHSAYDQKSDQLMQINQWHKDRDFLLSSRGYYVGYHFVINYEGQITQTKELDEEGCHTRGFNSESIGVCMEGDFTKHEPSEAQKVALGKLLVMLCERLHIGDADIYPHRVFGQTSCYGDFLSEDWARKLHLVAKDNFVYQPIQCETHTPTE